MRPPRITDSVRASRCGWRPSRARSREAHVAQSRRPKSRAAEPTPLERGPRSALRTRRPVRSMSTKHRVRGVDRRPRRRRRRCSRVRRLRSNVSVRASGKERRVVERRCPRGRGTRGRVLRGRAWRRRRSVAGVRVVRPSAPGRRRGRSATPAPYAADLPEFCGSGVAPRLASSGHDGAVPVVTASLRTPRRGRRSAPRAAVVAAMVVGGRSGGRPVGFDARAQPGPSGTSLASVPRPPRQRRRPSRWSTPASTPAHPAFGGRVLAQLDFVGDGKTGDPNGHGTHVAGTAAGGARLRRRPGQRSASRPTPRSCRSGSSTTTAAVRLTRCGRRHPYGGRQGRRGDQPVARRGRHHRQGRSNAATSSTPSTTPGSKGSIPVLAAGNAGSVRRRSSARATATSTPWS